MKLDGKTIVVTGASSGIGAETARLARFHGARVIGMDRNPATTTLDGFVAVDMSDPAAIDAAALQLPHRIDALVNAAGISGLADRDLVARVNYLGLRHLTEALVPRLAGGVVVNVTSILGYDWRSRLAAHKALGETASFDAGLGWLAENPVPQQTCYQYFKEALVVWTKKRGYSLFLDHDLRMNAVAPGPVRTPILGEFVEMLGVDHIKANAHTTKRPATADEIAPPIVFLCSDAARWVNGVNLPVDGGYDAFYV